MNIQDIMNEGKNGDKITVFINNKMKFASSTKGTVTQIRLDGCRGIAVNFEGTNWSTFFHEKSDADKRSRYMDSLSFIDNTLN